jgi:hypothetical protein
MVIKLFDMYGGATQDLILGTARHFAKFTIYKPATSRPCNSERYFIALGYSGSQEAHAWISHLQAAAAAKPSLTQLFENPWPPEICDAMQEQITWQETQQITTIEETLSLKKEDIPRYIERNIEMSKAWCETFKVPFMI